MEEPKGEVLIVSHPKTNESETLTFPAGTIARLERWAILEAVLASSEIENEGVPEHIANQLRDQIL